MTNLPVGLTCQMVDGETQPSGKRLADIRFHDGADVVRGQVLVEVLGRQHDLSHLDRAAVFVTHRDLALGIRTERSRLAGTPGFRQSLQDAVGIEDRRGHELRRLGAGIAEHDTLVAGALVLVAGGIDADGDVHGLRVQMHVDIRCLPMEAGLFVADIANGQPRRMRHEISRDRRGPAGFTGDHDAIGGGERLAGDAQMRRIPALLRSDPEEGIHDLVGYSVADLVGMTFGNGFTGEQIGRPGH